MGRGDGWLAAGHLPQGHHVVGGDAFIAGADLVNCCHFEGVNSKGLEVGDVEDCLRIISGDDLVRVPVCVLPLQDVYDVAGDVAVVGV